MYDRKTEKGEQIEGAENDIRGREKKKNIKFS